MSDRHPSKAGVRQVVLLVQPVEAHKNDKSNSKLTELRNLTKALTISHHPQI